MFFKQYFKQNRLSLMYMALIIALSSLISIPLPYISKYLIDDVILNRKYEEITQLAAIFLFILSFRALIGRINVYQVSSIEKKIGLSLRDILYKSFFNQTLSRADNNGNIQTVILNDVELFSKSVIQIITVFFSNITLLVGYVCMLFSINSRLTLISLLFIPIYVFWIIFVSNKLKILTLNLQRSKEYILKSINNTCQNLLTIKVYSLFKLSDKFYYNAIDKNADITKKASIFSNLITIISSIIINIASFLPLFLGVFFIKNGSLTIGSLIAFNSYSGMLFSPLTALIGLFVSVKTTQIHKERIESLIDDSFLNNYVKEELSDDRNSTHVCLCIENLEIKFNEKSLISHINLNVNKGEVIRLIGDNGTGKSLLLKSIVQIHKEYEGNILFYNYQINSLSVEDVSKDIIYVSNVQGMIFGSLKENLTHFDKNNDETINKILKVVNLFDRVNELFEGVESNSEEVLTQFSMGEMQKVRLARALLRKPKIMLIDEVFSNIDKRQVPKILNRIKNEFPELSIMLVEHHINDLPVDRTFQITDKKLVLTDCKI